MKNKQTISVCNIVKNEEKQMESFLSSLVDFADEIIIVDTGSSDKTLGIIEDFSKKYGNIKLYRYLSIGIFHYGKAKNFSIAKATQDYIIILDTDERLSDEFKNNIQDFLVKNNPIIASVKRTDDYLPHLIDYPERIIKNGENIFYKIDEDGMVHECLEHNHEVKQFNYTLLHCQKWNHYVCRPQRILFQLELQIERTPKTKSFPGHFFRGIWYFFYRFKKLFLKRKLYKDGMVGFRYSFIRSVDAFLVEFFVGLKSKNDYRYWEDEKSNTFK